jgi:hypothetical protein
MATYTPPHKNIPTAHARARAALRTCQQYRMAKEPIAVLKDGHREGGSWAATPYGSHRGRSGGTCTAEGKSASASFPTRPIPQNIVLIESCEHHHLWWERWACWSILVSANAPLWRKARRPHRCGARGPLRGHPTWSRKSPGTDCGECGGPNSVADELKQFATLVAVFHVLLMMNLVNFSVHQASACY